MTARPFTRRVRDAAAVLTRLIEDPEYAGQRWTWDTIGEVLELTLREAREVIYYLRDNASTFTWTVGTHASGWETMPSTSVRESLDGLVNQQRHLITRIDSQKHAWEVLAKVDPDPRMARVAKRQAKMFTRMGETIEDAIEVLLEITDESAG